MNKLNIVLLLTFLLPVNISAETKEPDTMTYIKEALIETKVAGMCGALKQLTVFQEATKMKGGDDFILRFFNTESARLGQTLEEFLLRCQYATKNYAEIATEFGLKK